MGRFSHEAAATDHRTGIVYETEDPGSGRGAGFYRFLPRNPRRLAAGGRLQILGIKGRPQYDAREGQKRGRRLDVKWIDVPEPDPEYDTDDDPRGTFQQGFRLGAAKFNRLEGCWYAGGSVFFVSTSGGDVKSGDTNPDGYDEGYGQVWEYRVRSRELVLHYESPGGEVMDSPDNLTVTPRGGVMVCEDDASDTDGHNAEPGDRHLPQRPRLPVRRERLQRVRARRSVLQPRRRHGVREPLRRLDGHPRRPRRRGHDVRDHRPVAQGAAVIS